MRGEWPGVLAAACGKGRVQARLGAQRVGLEHRAQLPVARVATRPRRRRQVHARHDDAPLAQHLLKCRRLHQHGERLVIEADAVVGPLPLAVGDDARGRAHEDGVPLLVRACRVFRVGVGTRGLRHAKVPRDTLFRVHLQDLAEDGNLLLHGLVLVGDLLHYDNVKRRKGRDDGEPLIGDSGLVHLQLEHVERHDLHRGLLDKHVVDRLAGDLDEVGRTDGLLVGRHRPFGSGLRADGRLCLRHLRHLRHHWRAPGRLARHGPHHRAARLRRRGRRRRVGPLRSLGRRVARRGGRHAVLKLLGALLPLLLLASCTPLLVPENRLNHDFPAEQRALLTGVPKRQMFGLGIRHCAVGPSVPRQHVLELRFGHLVQLGLAHVVEVGLEQPVEPLAVRERDCHRHSGDADGSPSPLPFLTSGREGAVRVATELAR